MKTSTKIVAALCITSILSSTIAMIIYFNITSVHDSSAIDAGNIIENGKAEILPEKLNTDFEVKQLNNKNSALLNDTLIMYKKIIPIK